MYSAPNNLRAKSFVHRKNRNAIACLEIKEKSTTQASHAVCLWFSPAHDEAFGVHLSCMFLCAAHFGGRITV